MKLPARRHPGPTVRHTSLSCVVEREDDETRNEVSQKSPTEEPADDIEKS